jgi:hypothetical protein
LFQCLFTFGLAEEVANYNGESKVLFGLELGNFCEYLLEVAIDIAQDQATQSIRDHTFNQTREGGKPYIFDAIALSTVVLTPFRDHETKAKNLRNSIGQKLLLSISKLFT